MTETCAWAAASSREFLARFLTLAGVSRGHRGVRVFDEDGDECIVEDVKIDGSDRWVIIDDELVCQAAN